VPPCRRARRRRAVAHTPRQRPRVADRADLRRCHGVCAGGARSRRARRHGGPMRFLFPSLRHDRNFLTPCAQHSRRHPTPSERILWEASGHVGWASNFGGRSSSAPPSSTSSPRSRGSPSRSTGPLTSAARCVTACGMSTLAGTGPCPSRQGVARGARAPRRARAHQGGDGVSWSLGIDQVTQRPTPPARAHVGYRR
jgi:hypothetical protein